MSKQAAPITNLRYYKNRTKRGNPTATPVKKGLNYYSFSKDEESAELEKRGEWHDQEGATVSIDAMTEWVSEQALENKYTYTAVLSLRDGAMQIGDFIQAMNAQEQFLDYRVIKHEDTHHDHAHVLMFREKTLTKVEFNKWRRTVGRELEGLERQRLSEQERPQKRSITNHIEFKYDF